MIAFMSHLYLLVMKFVDKIMSFKEVKKKQAYSFYTKVQIKIQILTKSY